MNGITDSSRDLPIASAGYPDTTALPDAAAVVATKVGKVAKRKMLGPIQGQAPKIARVVPSLEELCRKLDWEPFTFEATKVKEIAISAKNGNKNALLSLAYHYLRQARECNHTLRNYVFALSLFERKELEDHPYALFALGEMAEKGEGDPVNYERALTMYKKSAQFGLYDANIKCYLSYSDGVKFPVDYERALFYIKAAAAFGDESAEKKYGLLLFKVLEGMKNPDYKLAYTLLKKFADKGDAESAECVANMKYFGSGVKKSLKEAGAYFKIAIEGGFFGSYYNFLKSAQDGDMHALYIVGSFYESGISLLLKQDRERALIAYGLSAHIGNVYEGFKKVEELYSREVVKENPTNRQGSIEAKNRLDMEAKNIIEALLDLQTSGEPFLKFEDSVKALETLSATSEKARFFLKNVSICGSNHFNSHAGGIYFLKGIQNELLKDDTPFSDALLAKFERMKGDSSIPYGKTEEYRNNKTAEFSIQKLVEMYQYAISCGSEKAIIKLVNYYIDNLPEESFEIPIKALTCLVKRYYSEEARGAGCLFFDNNKSYIGKIYQKMFNHLQANPKIEVISAALLIQMKEEYAKYENSKAERIDLHENYSSGLIDAYCYDTQLQYVKNLYKFGKVSDEKSLRVLLKVLQKFPNLLSSEEGKKIDQTLDSLIFDFNLTLNLP